MSEGIALDKNELVTYADGKYRFNETEKKQFGWNVILLILMLVAGIGMTTFYGFDQKTESESHTDFSGVKTICELSTLRCYYHNVAELKKDPDGLFQYGWFRYGFKKLWMEYSGIVEVGVDVDQVQVSEPDSQNVVYVYVPNAKITNVSADSESMSEPISDTGVFTKITAEDQNQAFVQAQKDMETLADNDTSILNRAKNNAKKLIEQYIVNVGNQIGEHYTVKWLDEPKKTTGGI